MRRAHIVAALGVAVVITGCSGKPNDLRHYGQRADLSPTTGPSHPVATTTTGTGAPGTVAPVPLTGSQALATTLQRGLLNQADLAAEGVHPAGPPAPAVLPALATCHAPLDLAGRPAAAGYQARWLYASGSSLQQYLAGYPGARAAGVVDAVRRAVSCPSYPAPDGVHRLAGPVELPPQTGVDAQLAWCEHGAAQSGSCTLLLARGPLLTVVTIDATVEARARAAIIRVAPVAAAALRRG
ncbi:hypothetical protein [Gandjariella thermophila]|uniref:PknH-like extracellular domain-containing protein n=1 Tax=Gandjariella thermophila TaxID=1931992 RepID=A0A4D4J1A9_9PSEU|nr:hypothetical protein [Gandjariella thermophila]GDY28588.1 hypothetical protein GTS_02210 [Gandjariella thermophila]